MREERESVALGSTGLRRPAAALQPASVHWEARNADPSHCPWGNPRVLRRSNTKVHILFFRVSVSKSKLVVWGHL